MELEMILRRQCHRPTGRATVLQTELAPPKERETQRVGLREPPKVYANAEQTGPVPSTVPGNEQKVTAQQMVHESA